MKFINNIFHFFIQIAFYPIVRVKKMNIFAGCILNAGAIVDHDARLGAAVHVAPGGIVKAGAELADEIKVDSGEIIRSPWEGKAEGNKQ